MLYLDYNEDGASRTMEHPGWVKVFTSADVADRWFKESDPEGVAWEYEVEDGQPRGSVGSTRAIRGPGRSERQPRSPFPARFAPEISSVPPLNDEPRTD